MPAAAGVAAVKVVVVHHQLAVRWRLGAHLAAACAPQGLGKDGGVDKYRTNEVLHARWAMLVSGARGAGVGVRKVVG